MPTTIRPLTPDDTDASIALRREMLLDAPGSFGSDPTSDRGSDPKLVRAMLGNAPDQAIFGAFDDEACQLVGSIGFGRETRPKHRHSASLWGMYVSPTHRRRGIARQLIAATIVHAKSLDGLATLRLSVTDAAPGAHRLYASMGFAAWGTEPDTLRVNGKSHDEHHMVLMIGGR